MRNLQDKVSSQAWPEFKALVVDVRDAPTNMGRLWTFKKDEVDEWVKAGGAAEHTKRNLTKNE